MAWISPACTERLSPCRISLPSIPACKLLISNIWAFYLASSSKVAGPGCYRSRYCAYHRCSSNGSFQLHLKKSRCLDGKFHRQFAEDFLAEPVSYTHLTLP